MDDDGFPALVSQLSGSGQVTGASMRRPNVVAELCGARSLLYVLCFFSVLYCTVRSPVAPFELSHPNILRGCGGEQSGSCRSSSDCVSGPVHLTAQAGFPVVS